MRTRIKDVAKKANVSVGTVDRVIHNRGQVSATTQEKIMKIIEEIGYEPDIVASSLASKKTYRLSILIPMDNGENEYWNAPLKGFERAFNEIKHFNINIEYFLYNPQEKASF
ncbi:MAG: LacI family DNA-binding transcriptional regulator, partial [bacterium]